MKIGIYGGTFDPVHNGHIAVANIIARELSLDCVFFVIAYDTPLKNTKSEAAAALRFDMVKVALKNRRTFTASDIELKRGGKSYTVDTLKYFKERFPDAEIFFIIGGDRLADFSKWYRPAEIMKLCSLAVVKRKNAVRDYCALAAAAEREFGGKVYVSNAYAADISSTRIRADIFNALPVHGLLPVSAELMIYENALYVSDDISLIYEKLKTVLDKYRLRHTLLTVREAILLAHTHGVNTKKAQLAAILHDCAKLSEKQIFDYARDNGFELTDEELMNPYLIHARIGALIAERDYGIKDREILNAIARHTLGDPDMTMLDKVIYLADKLEPSRRYRRLGALRELAYRDIDAAVVAVMKHTVSFTKSSGRALHPSTLNTIAALENKKPKN